MYSWLVSPTAEGALALQSRAVCTVRALALASVGGGMDGVAPAYDELLCDCHSRCTALYDSPHDGLELATSYQQARLRNKAAGWVEAAGLPGQGGSPTPLPHGHGGMGIDTTPLGPELYADLEAGVCVLELFGGIGAVLEGLLRNCVRVCTYLYVDNDTEARQAMAHRLLELHERYPQQLPSTAYAAAFTALPPDVCLLTEGHLLEAGAASGVRWMVGAGWPCQDFSPAGHRAGLGGRRAGTYHALIRVLRILQRVQAARPPAYLLENGPMQLSFDVDNSIEADFKLICGQLGMPVLLDAARFGAYAYRLRNWWCNCLDPVELEAVAAGVRRAPHRYVVDILDSHHEMTGVIRTNGPPFYPVNRGGRVECLPTLVSFPGSRAFRAGKPGELHLCGAS